MKRIIIFISILTLLLSTTIGFAYANKAVEETHEDTLALSYTGPFEDIGKSVGEAIDNTVTSITKTVGNILKDLINYTVGKFKDVKVSDWFIDTVSKLVGKGGIDGYPDGTFRPNDTITKAEFIKMTVGSLGYKEVEPKDSHWAINYVKKAEEIGLIDKGEYKESELNQPINRYQMIKIVIKATEHRGEKVPDNYMDYANYIKDINSVPSKYRDYVIKSYALGIIDGYEDTSFKGDRNLTRAEAATVIVRIFGEDRVDVKDKVNDKSGDFIEPEFRVKMTTDYPHFFDYFEFIVTNYQDYVDRDYTFITECMSHPELNKRLVPDVFGDGYLESNQIEKYTMKSSRLLNQVPEGKIYELRTFRHDLNPKTNKPFKLNNREKLKYKVTVTNGKTTKTYELETVFKDKEFL